MRTPGSVRWCGTGERRIVLFPGFLTRGEILFRRHRDVLARSATVGLVEYPDHGRPLPAGLLAELLGPLRQAPPRSVTLVGASMGAQIAVDVLRALDRDGAGGVVGGYVPIGGPVDAGDVRAPLAVLGRLERVAPALAPVKGVLLRRMVPMPDAAAGGAGMRPEDLEARRADGMAMPVRALTGRLAALREHRPLRPGEFPDVVAVPLFAGGDADPLVRDTAVGKVLDAFPRGRRGHPMPPGHIGLLDHPDAYAAALDDALGRIAREAAARP